MSQVSTYLVPASSPTSQSEPPTPVDPTSTASSADKSPAEDAGHSICAHVEEKAKKKKDSMTRARRAQSWAQRRQHSDLRVEIPTTYKDFQHMSKGKCHSTFYFFKLVRHWIIVYLWVSGCLVYRGLVVVIQIFLWRGTMLSISLRQALSLTVRMMHRLLSEVHPPQLAHHSFHHVWVRLHVNRLHLMKVK